MTRHTGRLTSPLPGARDILRILATGGFRPKGAAGDARQLRRVEAPLPALTPREASLTWVGHATFLVRMGGKAILTDPVWSDRLPGRIPRLLPPGLAWEALPPIDAVVVSHNHYDHQDAATLRRLPRGTPIFVGLGGGRWFRRRGFSDVTELDWWQSAERGGVRYSFVPAHHWSRRGVFDLNRALWGGWVLEAAGRSAYFAGDTGYGRFVREIGARHPGLEVAMLPVGAYAPRWFMQAVHMDPDEAVQALADLGAARLAAMHWGTFPLTREPILEPLARTRAAWAAAGLPPDGLWDLAVGETRAWDGPLAASRLSVATLSALP